MMGKVAVMVKPMELQFQEYEVPDPEPGAIVVEVIRTNVCGSELHIWRGGHPIKKSGVLGHEMLGRVLRMGSGVTTDFAGDPIQVGDRVVATYFLTCRKCGPCQHGQLQLCENAYRFWNMDPRQHPHFHGSFATHYYVHPDQYFYKVPDAIPDNVAASVNCALSQVLFGIDRTGLTYGETIVIQGAGGLGLNAIAVAKERGAQVIVIDGIKRRLDEARRFGADHVIDMSEQTTVEDRAQAVQDFTGGQGADVGIEVAGVPAAFAEGIRLVRVGGRYVELGNITPGHLVEFDPGLLTRRGITIMPTVRYLPWYLKTSLDLLARVGEKYPFGGMLDREFTLDQTVEALELSERRELVRASIVNG